VCCICLFFFFSSRRRHTRWPRDWSSDVCSSDLHIERFLSTYFSPNTHLLGEGMALFFIGLLCAGIPSARRWQEGGWKIILREARSEEHTSELQSRGHLVCRLLLEKKNKKENTTK